MGMAKIYLNDILNFTKEEIANVKVKFNQWNGTTNPMDEYLQDPEIVNTGWLFWRTQQSYFRPGQIAVCLLKLNGDKWLLTTIKQVTKDLKKYNDVAYEGVEIEKYKPYFGRVIISYHKKSMQQGRFYEELHKELVVNQILPEPYGGKDFPGYDKVCLSFTELANIIKLHKKDWVGALENQKAVYLITDKNNGKLYVGSATAENGMLLARWRDYAQTGHGGNKDLRQLVQELGFDYVKQHFQYSILENFNARIDDSVILERESWWKEVLQSRKFWYNCN